MSQPNETTSLLPKQEKTFYFLNKQHSLDKFTPTQGQQAITITDGSAHTTSVQENKSYISYLFTGLFTKQPSNGHTVIENNADKPRSIPVKIEPKVFFANERTYLAWLHMSVTLASISVAIVA